jgi:hypothetical protein
MKKLELKHIAAYLPYGVKALKRDMFPPNEYKVTVMKGLRLFMLSQDEKIILRPLSDLTKPITHNGENFVPMEKLRETDAKSFEFYSLFGTEVPDRIPYNLLVLLHEWHFDVYSLIPDCAIDMNTLTEQK